MTLAISGSAKITFQNKGDDKITTPFNVLVFEDRDGDAAYTAGVDLSLGSALATYGTPSVPPALWPEGVGMVTVPLTGTVAFLHSPLYALIDSGDAIREQDETNNYLVSCKECEVVPTNPFQPMLKWKWWSMQYEFFATPPSIMHLRDTNGDGNIDQNDMPDIV